MFLTLKLTLLFSPFHCYDHIFFCFLFPLLASFSCCFAVFSFPYCCSPLPTLPTSSFSLFPPHLHFSHLLLLPLSGYIRESRRPLAGVAANKMQRPSPIMSLIQYASSFKVVKAFRIACLWNVSQRRLRYTTWRQFLACSVCDAFCIHIVWHLLLLLCASCFRLEHVHDGVDAVEIYAQRVMHWVASHPVGLKLCAPLSLMYASVFLYTVRLWTHMVHVVINVGVWLGASVHASTGLYILGASGTFALTADIITYALPWHIIVFYQTFRVLYCCQLAVIKSVALTFMGARSIHHLATCQSKQDYCIFLFHQHLLLLVLIVLLLVLLLLVLVLRLVLHLVFRLVLRLLLLLLQHYINCCFFSYKGGNKILFDSASTHARLHFLR